MTKMRGHIARGRSCPLHGDNGCEIQRCAGYLEREDEKRFSQAEIEQGFADYADESLAIAREMAPAANATWLDTINGSSR